MENYYELNAKEYIDKTKDVNMKEEYDKFFTYVKPNSHILDLGFGSGRDSLYFKNNGHFVTAIDNVEEFVLNAKKLGIDNVYNMDIRNINFHNEFDAIWASASLLHIPTYDLMHVLNKLYIALKNEGILYMSFKYGDFEGRKDDRFYNDLNETKLKNILSVTEFKVLESYKTIDNLGRENTWFNIILKK
jgi:ubiquinone/menaquinone biosynthesis C-methylase UbiE